MKFSQFCDMTENTANEQRFFQLMQEKEDLQAFVQIAQSEYKNIPLVGKFSVALAELVDCGSIAEFRHSEHYDYIKDWEFKFDFDSGNLTIVPSDVHIKKFAKILMVIFAVITAIVVYRKFCRRKKCK